MKRKKVQEKKGSQGVARWAIAVLLIAVGVILLLADFGAKGIATEALFNAAYGFFGIATYLLPIVLIAGGVMIILKRSFVEPLVAAGGTLIAVSILAILGVLSSRFGLSPDSPPGGALGSFIGGLSADFFGVAGSVVLLLSLILLGLIIATDIVALMNRLMGFAKEAGDALGSVQIPSLPETTKEKGKAEAEPEPEPIAPEREPTVTMFTDNDTKGKQGAIPNFDAEYNPPPISILGEDKGKPASGDIKANANVIKRTFQNFGINVEMDEVSIGPTVTRYAIKPAEGVRLSKVVSLQSNLELALAAHPVRIEAPIPGKSLVGIEVPNAAKAMVGLGGVLSSPEWNTSDKPLLAAIGRDITGMPHYVNIAKMPHGLVAGATGSGKSVAIHALITSLLYRNGPNQLRFIMVDPKRVELTLYNGIPHLLTPVITDPKKAIMALKWAAKEMDRRYNILEAEQVRDIDSYHKTVVEPAKKKKGGEMPESMPYIVIVVDELADIMQSYPRELEAGIVRLAQMSRAVGIHLVLSTQRPSVNVITGLIKANVPTRMALQVASQIDSRTILDGGGAESLLGAGDMLYLSSDMQKPVRLQTAYISENEVKKVASYIKQHNAGSLNALDLGGTGGGMGNNGGQPIEMNDAIMLSGGDDDVDDDLYMEAKAAVEEAGRASTSYLQRKLRIGYSRAARLIDILEEKGVIGSADGSRPRDILSKTGAAPVPEAADERPF